MRYLREKVSPKAAQATFLSQGIKGLADAGLPLPAQAQNHPDTA